MIFEGTSPTRPPSASVVILVQPRCTQTSLQQITAVFVLLLLAPLQKLFAFGVDAEFVGAVSAATRAFVFASCIDVLVLAFVLAVGGGGLEDEDFLGEGLALGLEVLIEALEEVAFDQGFL